MRLAVLLFVLASVVAPLNILLYSSCVASSHLSYANQLTNTLIENGHTVDFIVARVNSLVKMKKSRARKSITVNFPNNDSPWNKKASYLSDPFVDMLSIYPFKRTVFHTYTDVMNQLCGRVLDSPEVAEMLSSTHYDVALVTGYDFCPHALLYSHKIPIVQYSPVPLFSFQILHSGVPELPLYENHVIDSLPRIDRRSFFDRTLDWLRTAYGRWVHEGHVEEANALFRSRYGASFPDARELAKRVSFDFINTFSLLDEPRPITSRIKYIGGIGLPEAKPLSKEIDSILETAKKGNVIFSFGTQVPPENIRPQIVNSFVEAFKRFSEYNFIWKYDGHTQLNASNVFNVEWLPQTDMLADSRVVAFISHMGLNSFVESSLAGVPCISIPLMVDQYHNARQAVRLGTGVILEKTGLSEEKITGALRKVLEDPSYKERASVLKEKLRENPEQSERTLLESIEFAAKFPDLYTHYTLLSSELSWFSSLGYDVVVFLSLSSLFVILSGIYLTFVILPSFVVVKKVKSE